MKMDKITRWKGLLTTALFVQLLFTGDCGGRNFGIEEKSKSTPNNTTCGGACPGVEVRLFNASRDQVILDNGIVQVTFQVPEGCVSRIRFGGIDNILEANNGLCNRGYWDTVSTTNPNNNDRNELGLGKASFKIITQSPEKAEISFFKSGKTSLPLQIDLRFVLLKGRSGFYSYAIFERAPGFPQLDVYQIRSVYKLQADKFHYMAVSDKLQREMPMEQDRETGKPLDYKEAILLTHPIDPKLKGQVDDKYQYACEDKDNKLHGWFSSNPSVGIWMITPSDEFRMGGPHKQDLTSHVGPTMLSMFHSTHYGGIDLTMRFNNGETWKKVFGPILVHLNSNSGKGDFQALWQQAKEQLVMEKNNWPYDFPASEDFPKTNQRGSVMGRLLVKDGENAPVPAKSGWVGLSSPGDAGSWQYETKGYQFWIVTDTEGKFLIPNVRVGEYNLFGWVPGYIGDFKSAQVVNVVSGKDINLGDQIFEPPRSGSTLWEIGFPDRSAAEFFVPDPSPQLSNPVFLNDPADRYRQYGLWDRYTELYPNQDLSYTVGVSDFRKHWFFAHVLRKIGVTYKATTWQITFPLEKVVPNSMYTLQIALASASEAELQVRINNPDVKTRPIFTSMLIGKDNAIARHGIHGLYWLYTIGVASKMLRVGNNTIYLTQSRENYKFHGLMYDYLRLEGPGSPHKLS